MSWFSCFQQEIVLELFQLFTTSNYGVCQAGYAASGVEGNGGSGCPWIWSIWAGQMSPWRSAAFAHGVAVSITNSINVFNKSAAT